MDSRARLTAFLISLAILTLASAARAEIAFYVSPSGKDQWSGTLPEAKPDGSNGPFATVERARDAVRAIRSTANEAITVYLRGGTYDLQRSLDFDARDSGSRNAPVTYMSYGDERPVLSGGVRIGGWQPYGIDGLWFVRLEDVAAGSWYFNQLFINGQRRQRSRLPNIGHYTVVGVVGSNRFTFRPGDISRNWTNLNDVDVVVLNRFVDAHLPIAAVEESPSIVTFTKSTRMPIDQGARYYVDNVFEGLDEAGEWYLDRNRGLLFYKPMPGEDLLSAEVVAPRLRDIVTIMGDQDHPVHDITLSGLTLAYNDWKLKKHDAQDLQASSNSKGSTGIYIQNAERITIEGCTLQHLGSWAIDAGWSNHLEFVRNSIRDIAAGGISLWGGYEPSERTYANVITDNKIENVGQVFHSAVGIWLQWTDGNRIAYNEISDLTYSGISVGWNWGYDENPTHHNIIEFNHVHDIKGRDLLNDLGGIYMLGKSPGTVIRGNYVHDIDAAHEFGIGIYLDEGSSGILVEGNVTRSTNGPAFFLHYGRENTVRNNLFAFGKRAQFGLGQQQQRGLVVESNILVWQSADLFGSWSKDFTSDVYHHNVYFTTDGSPIRFGDLTFEQWQKYGQDIGSTIADPMIQWSENSLTLSQESPAFARGFQPIDLSSVGPRKAGRVHAIR